MSDLPLTAEETTRLAILELTVQQGLKNFIEVGAALFEIRESKLYRHTHSNFEEYCRGKFNISRSYASRLIQAKEVVENVLPIGNKSDIPPPTNESQTRELAKSPPTKQKRIWHNAIKLANGLPPTSTLIKLAAQPRKVIPVRNPDGSPNVAFYLSDNPTPPNSPSTLQPPTPPLSVSIPDHQLQPWALHSLQILRAHFESLNLPPTHPAIPIIQSLMSALKQAGVNPAAESALNSDDKSKKP